MCMSVCLCLSVCLSLSLTLSVSLSVCLSVCLCLYGQTEQLVQYEMDSSVVTGILLTHGQTEQHVQYDMDSGASSPQTSYDHEPGVPPLPHRALTPSLSQRVKFPG